MYKELAGIRDKLEQHYHDMQDIEFTIQDGKLYMLQCRSGKRTGTAALNMAMDMLAEGLIDEETAVTRVAPEQLDELLQGADMALYRVLSLMRSKDLPMRQFLNLKSVIESC